MVKSIHEAMEELRRDLSLWRRQIDELRGEGAASQIEALERAIADAEKVLRQWDERERG